MALTLTTARDAVETQLSDLTNLIWSITAIDEAIRSALRDLSKVYGSAITLNGLDGALVNNFDLVDEQTIIAGAAAYALNFRAIEILEQASPSQDSIGLEVSLATNRMNDYQSLLTQVTMRRFQTSDDSPHSAWDWEEGSGF